MKNAKQQPAQKEFTTSSTSRPGNNQALAVTAPVTASTIYHRIDDAKHIRRYSIDDNGGGYLGL